LMMGSMLYPCTTVLVGRALTVDGSIIHAHNEDMGNRTVGRLWKVQSDLSTEPDSIWVPYVTIPELGEKLGYWASGNTSQVQKDELNNATLPYDNILVGMNEAGLTMSCNWMYSKDEVLEEKGVRRYAIRQLILERCSSASEAVTMIGNLIDTYGQADWGGLTYVLADKNEGWIVETTTHCWVAKKLKDYEIIAIANRYTIEEDFDLSSKNLIQYATDKKWYDPADGNFNFKNVYGDQEYMNEKYDKDREERVYQLLNEKKGNIRPVDLMTVLRDRYNNTDEYTSPTTFEPDRLTCRERDAKRPICTNLCQSSFVAHLRQNLPVEYGSVFWYTMATPAYGPYFPIYPFGSEIDKPFSLDNPDETESSAWWTYRHLQQIIDISDEETIDRTRKEAGEITEAIKEKQSDREKKLQDYINSGKILQAREIANKQSTQSAQKSLQYAKTVVKR